MSWIYVLGIVVVLVALAALTGWKPDETKPVGRTRLLAAARVVLAVFLVLLVAGLVLAWIG